MPRVLIVDGSSNVRSRIVAALSSVGYDADAVSCGRDAVVSLKQHAPDIIILDIADTTPAGLTFLRLQHRDAIHRHIPVVLVTDVTDRELVFEAGRLGVRDYLLKSRVSLAVLLERLRSHLEDATGVPPDESMPGVGEIESLTKPLIRRRELLESLDAFGDLRALSPTVGKILDMTSDPNCEIEDVARVVKQDQAIALKVLRLANSGTYKRGKSVGSVYKAVRRMGLNAIRQVVLNVAVIDRFRGSGRGPNQPRLRGPLFWEHSTAAGIIAAELTRAMDGRSDEIETAFSMGLLHDIGRLILADVLGSNYERVLEIAEAHDVPLEWVESKLVHLNHAEITDKILRGWNFSGALIDPIALHHLSVPRIQNASPLRVTQVAILALANRLAHAMMLGSSGNDAIYPTEVLVELLKLDGQDIDRIVEEAPGLCHEVKEALMPAGPGNPWPDFNAEVRHRLGVPLRPLYVGSKPQIDAFRLFADSVRDPDAEASDPPNLAIVRLRSPRDAAVLGPQLLEAESALGIGPLPTIVVSAKGELDLELEGPRPVFGMQTPMSVRRFVEAVSQLLGATADVPQVEVA